jgi:hypothetical protein
VTGWHGQNGIRRPFRAWAENGQLPWYQAYNQAKHDRHNCFTEATFAQLVDAFCGLLVLLTAQFGNEDFTSGDSSLTISGYSYVVVNKIWTLV